MRNLARRQDRRKRSEIDAGEKRWCECARAISRPAGIFKSFTRREIVEPINPIAHSKPPFRARHVGSLPRSKTREVQARSFHPRSATLKTGKLRSETTMTQRTTPPFRADHVGSLL